MDWRKDYIICEHVEKDSQNLRHRGQRACCQECYDKGFCEVEHLDIHEKNGLCFGKIKA